MSISTIPTANSPWSDAQLAKTFPSIPLAYEFVRPSYEIMLKRLEIMEGRARGLMTLIATVIFGVPAFAKAILLTVDFAAPTFIAAAAIAILAQIVGLWAQSAGKITVYSPRLMYDNLLRLGEIEFKKDSIYSAAEAFDVNSARVDSKARAIMAMTMLLVLQIGLLVAWIVLQR